MTDQYNQPNINRAIPRNSRIVTEDTQLNLDDDLIVVDSALQPIQVDLPRAEENPGRMIYIKAPVADVQNVTVAGSSGETIDGLAFVVLNVAQSGLIVKAESETPEWRILGQFPAATAPLTTFNRAPVNLPPQIRTAPSGTPNDGEIYANVHGTETGLADGGAYSNTDVILWVPDSYLGVGEALVARAVAISTPLTPAATAAVTGVAPFAIGAGLDGIQLTIEGVRAPGPSSEEAFFALYAGKDDGGGSPTPETEQFAGYFIVWSTANPG